METSLELCCLLSEQLKLKRPTQAHGEERFVRLVNRVMRQAGIARPGQAQTRDAQIVRLFLLMTKHSYQQLLHPTPPPSGTLVERAKAYRESAPQTKGHFAQSRCDTDSVCRRATEIEKRVPPGSEILVIGDDDGVGPLLSPRYKVTVLDLDVDVLDWVKACEENLQTLACDVRELPTHFRERFSAAVADPIRGMEAESFLKAAQVCLKPGGHFFWADHPDWNSAFPALRFEAEQDFELLATLANWHRYSASLLSGDEELGKLDPESRRFLQLGELISFWSNLYVFRKRES